MVLGAFWRSLGLLFGPLGGRLGDLWRLLGVSWATFGGSKTLTGPIDRDFGALWKVFGALLRSSLVHVFFEIVFCSFSKLLGSILSSQDEPPNLKNLDFASDIH